eukprot:m.221086 g.221086  ORF g.221086 m.221086 type:complete len:171 (-) comp15124_c2_seq6:483-995(-)
MVLAALTCTGSTTGADLLAAFLPVPFFPPVTFTPVAGFLVRDPATPQALPTFDLVLTLAATFADVVLVFSAPAALVPAREVVPVVLRVLVLAFALAPPTFAPGFVRRVPATEVFLEGDDILDVKCVWVVCVFLFCFVCFLFCTLCLYLCLCSSLPILLLLSRLLANVRGR